MQHWHLKTMKKYFNKINENIIPCLFFLQFLYLQGDFFLVALSQGRIFLVNSCRKGTFQL